MNQIETRMNPDGFYVAQSLEEVLERKKQVDSRLGTITAAGNPCHDENGKFCEKAGSPGHKDHPSNHLDKQIKDLEDMINMYKDEEGGEKAVEMLSKNLKALKDKKASGAEPYHGADLYIDPKLMDYDRKQEIQSIKETMDIIAKVHEPDPTLQPVRIWKDDSLRGGVLGAYKPAFNQIGVQDINDRFSLVHELGHWQTLNPNFSMDAGTDPSKHFLENVNKLDLGNVYYHITQSNAIKSIDEKAKNSHPYTDSKAYAEYLNTPHERYARAYAQYIAIRSNNPELKDQFERFRSNNRVNNVQWTDSDFAPIAKSFDEHFASKRAKSVRASGNPCHDRDTGQFCEIHGSDVRHFGLEDWPKDRSKIVLSTVKKLQDKYGITVTINATDTPQNGAVQLEALASVDTPTLIDVHPSMKSQEWQDENSPKDLLVSDKLEHVITHEYGHVLEIELELSDPKAFKELRKPFIEAQNSLSDLEDGVGKGGAYKDLISKVSPYAGDSVEEGIAEAFLQHEMGIQNKYSDHVGMHFNNLIQGRYSRNDHSN